MSIWNYKKLSITHVLTGTSDERGSAAAFDASGPGAWEPSYTINELYEVSRTIQVYLARNHPHIMIHLAHAFDSDDDGVFCR